MTALAAVQLGVGGTLGNPLAATDGDTISGNDVASGAILEVHNGAGSPITVQFADPGHTPAGNTGTQPAVTVANGTTKRFKPTMALVDGNNVVTVHYSSVTSVTYELYT